MGSGGNFEVGFEGSVLGDAGNMCIFVPEK